jgi:hypothetical protein
MTVLDRTCDNGKWQNSMAWHIAARFVLFPACYRPSFPSSVLRSGFLVHDGSWVRLRIHKIPTFFLFYLFVLWLGFRPDHEGAKDSQGRWQRRCGVG